MASYSNVSLSGAEKPSKFLALVALAIAFCLPFILVKSFPHKTRSSIEKIPPLKVATPSRPPQIKEASFDKAIVQTLIKETNKSVKTELITPRPITTENKKVPPAPQPNLQKHSQSLVKASLKAAASKEEAPRLIVIKSRNGDSLDYIFNRSGLNPSLLKAIMQKNPYRKFLTRIPANMELQLLIKNHSLEKLTLPISATQYLTIQREKGQYRTKINQRKVTTRTLLISARVHGSLYGTAKRRNIPYKLMQQMTEIFTWDINFARDVRDGDQFTILYHGHYIDDKLITIGDIQAVSYTNRGKNFQALRHTSRSGRSDYYTPQGTGLKKAFSRYPLQFSHISSSFSLSRYHPILHYRRAHKGVDLAARIGTPIQATGDGRIEIIGRQNAYGNMIKIKHNKTYSTIYGHMLKFQKGLSKGSFVKRGQIIGYVGQTGLASGPHCHYEFHINNQPKNPSTINLPRSEPISGAELRRFKLNATTLLAQLKRAEKNELALATPQKKH